MIEIKNLTLQRGLKILLDKANATVNPGQRVGLIGKNGTGRSSLFALLKGEITQGRRRCLDSEKLAARFRFPRNARFGYFRFGLRFAGRCRVAGFSDGIEAGGKLAK